MLVIMYLGAIVLANLLVAQFGPAISIFNAFVLIGLDLSARDGLHELWRGSNLRLKMALLIGTGSAISFALNRDAGPIALASFVAFAAAGAMDTVVYSLLFAKPRQFRMNASNVFSAAVDSLVFPALAFGFPLLWGIVLGQFVAKVAGGAIWAWILTRPALMLRSG